MIFRQLFDSAPLCCFYSTVRKRGDNVAVFGNGMVQVLNNGMRI